MKVHLLSSLALVMSFAISVIAAEPDYRVEALSGGAPVDELPEAIGGQIGATGVKLVRGEDTTVCEIWPCKEWPIKAGFQPTAEVLYPFQPGQLLGVIRYARRGNDFRDQQVARGVYTMRYQQQPVDGNHVGTSPTKDFLLLVKAESDETAAPLEADPLNTLSAEAVESTHPGMLCLQTAQQATGEKPTLRHDSEKDWWIVQLTGKAVAEQKPQDLPVALVLVGKAPE